MWYPTAGDIYGPLVSWLVLSPPPASAETAPQSELTFVLPEALTGLKMEGPMRVFFVPPVLESGAGRALAIELLEGAWAIEKAPKPAPPDLIVDEGGIVLPLAD